MADLRQAPPPPVGRIECDQLGTYIHNTRLNYFVTDLTTGQTQPGRRRRGPRMLDLIARLGLRTDPSHLSRLQTREAKT